MVKPVDKPPVPVLAVRHACRPQSPGRCPLKSPHLACSCRSWPMPMGLNTMPPHPPPPSARLSVFNLVEGDEATRKATEEKVAAYRRTNADSIVRNEARRAEELRRRVAAAEEGAGQAGISGTAAAFAEGKDAEPHQGMEYTAALPEVAAAALGA